MTGAEFRAIRKHLRMTQTELAARMGYSHKQSISRIENMGTVPENVAAHIGEVQANETSVYK